MEYPLWETGDRRFRIDDDKYIKDVSELTETIHKYGCPTFVQFYHRGHWGGIYRMAAPLIAASAFTITSEHDVHEESAMRVTKRRSSSYDHYAARLGQQKPDSTAWRYIPVLTIFYQHLYRFGTNG
jgi:hypothetical protein